MTSGSKCALMVLMKTKLTKTELKESLFITFGRLLVAIRDNQDLERAKILMEKLDRDFKKAYIEENYFKV